MALSGAEIQTRLQAFADKWQAYAGSERAEAQTFLNELYACYGTDRMEAGAKFEDFKTSAGFMDLHQPGVCIVEMKRPGTKLSTARDQVRRYREESADEESHIPAARYVVICSFQQFEIWQPGDYPKHQVGLTKLYNAMDEGAYAELKSLHREVDEAIADCYRWPRAVAQDDHELVVRLTELNRQITEGERTYLPFD